MNKTTYTLVMERKSEKWLRSRRNIFVHLLIWCIVIVFPLIIFNREESVKWSDFLRFLPVFTAFLFMFYINYFYLVDNLLFKHKTALFVVINLILIMCVALLLHFIHEIAFTLNVSHPPEVDIRHSMPPKRPILAFIFRDIFSLSFVALLGILMRASERITRIQSQHKELEKAMVEAELKNLKNQINPHFLMNTLNNIYALSIANSPKTSESIMGLSELLGYLLYKDDKSFVLLREETAFLSNYIDLMKLRINDNVTVTTNIRISEDSTTEIAPLIYISLIENAFKHGVSSDDSSFINIELSEDESGKVHFLCNNSFFPKDESDRSGSGIGLQQVQKRLDLIYPYRYMWHNELVGDVYSTVLIINSRNDDESKDYS